MRDTTCAKNGHERHDRHTIRKFHPSAFARVLLTLLVLAWGATGSRAQAADVVDATTLTGKLIMGYQGWFSCPGDSAGLGWDHWGNWKVPAIPTVDMLPDVSELAPAERCVTGAKTADGAPVELFSDANPETVARHFAWMQRYNLDGVAVQRFAAALLMPKVLKARDRMLDNVLRGAERYGRVFFVMYDLSGFLPEKRQAVIDDWRRLEQAGITRSRAYLHHRGHPLLGVWGLGFAGRPLTAKDAAGLLDDLVGASAPYGGITLLGGVPTNWRGRASGRAPADGWSPVWRRLGVISPWSILAFSNDREAADYRLRVVRPDVAEARALGVDYMPVVYPGFSIANARRAQGHADLAIPNRVPRQCGEFFWRQVHDDIQTGAKMLYGAMFDEVNEGTALFKVVAQRAQLPVSGVVAGDSFVPLDLDGCRLPSDWYLRLAGAATAALRSGSKVSIQLPLQVPN
jgi:hypothetical protein